MKKELSWSSIAVFFKLFTQWFLITVLTKSCDIEIVGLYTYSLALIAPTFMFTGMQLRNIQVVDVNSEYPFGAYLFTRSFYVLVTSIVFLFLSFFLFNNGEQLLFILVLLLRAQEQILDIIYGKFQKDKRFDLMAKSSLWRGCGDLLIFSFIFFYPQYILFVFSVSILYQLFVFFLYDLRKAKYKIDLENLSIQRLVMAFKNYIKPLTKKSISLGLTVLISSLTTNLPRYIIKGRLGLEVLGVYGALSYVVLAFFNLFQPLQLTIRVELANLYQKNKIKFTKLKIRLLLIYIISSLVVIIGLFWRGNFLLSILFTKEYAEYISLFIAMFIGASLTNMGVTYGLSLQAKQIFNKQVYISILVFSVSGIATYLCIKQFGINGIAYSSICIGATSLISYYLWDKYYE